MSKKVLLFILLILGMHRAGQATPCNLVKATVDVISTVPSGAGCIITANISFEITNNSGNKWIFVHLWKNADYPGLTYNSTPDSTQLATSFINIAIDHQATIPVISSYYPNDSRVAVIDSNVSPGLQLYELPGSQTGSNVSACRYGPVQGLYQL